MIDRSFALVAYLSKVLSLYRAFYNPFAGARSWLLGPCVLLVLTGGLCPGISARADGLTVRLSLVSLSPAVVKIEGETLRARDIWSFRNTYGRVIGLGERIDNFRATDSAGLSVAVLRLGIVDFKSERPVSHFSYQVCVTEPANSLDEAHVSWLNEQFGYLMLADLLPSIAPEQQHSAAVQIEFRLPPNWEIASSAQVNREGRFAVPDPDTAVFFIGNDLRVRHKQIGGTEFLFAAVGAWPFPGDYVTAIAARIIKDHARHTGFEIPDRAVLMLAPYRGKEGAERWTAETRGSNVVLLLGPNSPPDVLLGRLSVILTHELFHLWVPGALSFIGDYDWFFEGFTLYQALCSAVRLGLIDFQEYLSTMARVYDSYLATSDRDRLSLVDASRQRWTIGSSLVYDKGMLVGFLCDLSLRILSRNRRSLDNLYRELFRQQRAGGPRVDGNEVLINLLNRELGMEQFTRHYLSTPGAVRLETELSVFGLMVESSDNHSRLKVIQGLSNEERRLLESLGYRKPRQ